jgi:ribonuclease HI
LLICGDTEKELSGHAPQTTNNRMEMTAVIEGLNALKTPCHINLYTDSTYVRDGITKWIVGWQKKGWKTADNKPVKNIDLWQAMLAAIEPHKVAWHWVKGHADNDYNNRVDVLASDAALDLPT